MSRLQRFHLLINIIVVMAIVIALLGVERINTQAAPDRGVFSPANRTDQTPNAPLANPNTRPTDNRRYLSGIGLDSNFTIFFED